MRDLANEEHGFDISIQRRRRVRCHDENDQSSNTSSRVTLHFPGQNAAEVWRLSMDFDEITWKSMFTIDMNVAVLLRLLDIIHEALCDDTILSKR